jgi:hypothetical protein
LPIGRSALDVAGVLRVDGGDGFAGLTGSLLHHIDAESVTFLRGTFGQRWDSLTVERKWEVLAGVRIIF